MTDGALPVDTLIRADKAYRKKVFLAVLLFGLVSAAGLLALRASLQGLMAVADTDPDAALAFVPHRQACSSLAPSPLVVPQGLSHFTATPGVPQTFPTL